MLSRLIAVEKPSSSVLSRIARVEPVMAVLASAAIIKRQVNRVQVCTIICPKLFLYQVNRLYM